MYLGVLRIYRRLPGKKKIINGLQVRKHPFVSAHHTIKKGLTQKKEHTKASNTLSFCGPFWVTGVREAPVRA